MNDEPKPHYTTITIEEYQHMKNVILQLRWTNQKARELIESNQTGEALNILRKTEEE